MLGEGSSAALALLVERVLQEACDRASSLVLWRALRTERGDTLLADPPKLRREPLVRSVSCVDPIGTSGTLTCFSVKAGMRGRPPSAHRLARR